MKYTLKKVLTILLVISILVLASIPLTVAATTTATAPRVTFKDLKTTAWYYTYVNKLIELKITAGYQDSTYKPTNSVTRAEFITFLCKTKGYTQTKGDPFTDTQKSWATGYITIALANGIIDLPTDKEFRPNDPITRLEAVEMLCRALNISKDTITKNPYSDVKTITGYTNAAYANYLMQGSIEKNIRYFKPSDKLTRGEVAAVIVNAYDYNTDKMAFLNEKITAASKKAAAEKAEKERYAAWQESVKGMSAELLSNTDGLTENSLYENNKYFKTESGYLSGWGKDYGMTDEEFANEIVRVGSKYANLIANANYKKIDTYEATLKALLEENELNNYLKKKLDYVKSNTIVSEGRFTTSTGLIVFTDNGSIALRGTIKYKYSKPTSTNVLNSEIVGSTKKPSLIGVWYEQDFEISFYPEKDSLKTTRLQPISDIRISKYGG